jgi:serine/threonine-protein kinase
VVTKVMTDLLGRERYEVDRALGQGAMGSVYLARDTILDRVVAVKVLADHLAADEDFRRRFVQEARLAARLCHPNVVQVFDAGDDEGRPFLVMEYVDGVTVADRLTGDRRFAGEELLALAAQLAAGLAQAHAEGIVHRDVKPHNVLLRRDGVAKLTDFGIARAVEERGLTQIGTVLGTVPYMAPEQAAGRAVGPAADVYALGALIRAVAAGPLPAGLASLVDTALASDPAARPSAAEVHGRLVAMADPSAAVAAAAPVRSDGAGTAPTQIRLVAGTVVAPPADEPASASAGGPVASGWLGPVEHPIPALWPRYARPAVIAVALVLFLAVAPHLRGPGGKPATPPPVAPAATVSTANDPAQGARAFADWLRGQSTPTDAPLSNGR